MYNKDAACNIWSPRLTSEVNLPILFILLAVSGLTVCSSPAPQSAAERRQVQARVSPLLVLHVPIVARTAPRRSGQSVFPLVHGCI